MKKRNRRGYTLAFFVLFLVMCFALAALLIDIGLVHLTRRQLQTAANTAAKEALYDVDGDGRVNAQRFVQAVFDDDFDPTTADALSLGAGPDVPYYDGEQISGDFRASAKYYLPDDPFSPVPSGRSAVGVYKPDVALNAGNEADGDIVRGRYIEIEEDLSKDHTESSYNTSDPYRRDDFEPDPLGNSVLVRMRRTGEPSDGVVRTSGPPVPFMFGRGLLSAGSQEFWSKIERGTHVRATAIANATPARTCGVAHPGLIGLINVQMSVATWEDGTPAVIGNGPNEIQIFDNLEVTAIGRRPFDNGSGPPTLIKGLPSLVLILVQ